jgi:hypothetical protein
VSSTRGSETSKRRTKGGTIAKYVYSARHAIRLKMAA